MLVWQPMRYTHTHKRTQHTILTAHFSTERSNSKLARFARQRALIIQIAFSFSSSALARLFNSSFVRSFLPELAGCRASGIGPALVMSVVQVAVQCRVSALTAPRRLGKPFGGGKAPSGKLAREAIQPSASKSESESNSTWAARRRTVAASAARCDRWSAMWRFTATSCSRSLSSRAAIALPS